MSNYRVRQVLALPHMPDRERTFLVALATFMNDDDRIARVGTELLQETANLSRPTFRAARRGLIEAGRLAYEPGSGRKQLTVWTVLCLPEKGARNGCPLSGAAEPVPETGKGVSSGPERGQGEAEKGGKGQAADQAEPATGYTSWLNPRAESPDGSVVTGTGGRQQPKPETDSHAPSALQHAGCGGKVNVYDGWADDDEQQRVSRFMVCLRCRAEVSAADVKPGDEGEPGDALYPQGKASGF